jgi:hypothetical protein
MTTRQDVVAGPARLVAAHGRSIRAARPSLVALLPPALVLLVLLLAVAGQYGFHRDELYFRLLPAAWGYTDQPPFTPLVAHLMTGLADEPWALRIPAAVVAALSAIVVGLLAAEVGGGRGAQALAAWGAGFGYYPLLLGHVLFTATFDLLVWPLILLCILRAVLRRRGSWFLVAGLVAGLSLYNKLLVLTLLLAVAVGLAVAGPRRASVWGWATAGSLLVVVIGAPNLVYQLVHGLPQLQVGSALTAQNAADVRPFVLPFLLVLLGPFLVPIWVAGLVAPFRRPGWRDVRWLPVAFVVIVAIVLVMGAQLYYDLGVLTAVFAIGCVPAAEWAATLGRRRLVAAGIAVNALAAIAFALPVLPRDSLAGTVLPSWNQSTRDQLGWPTLAAQIGAVPEADDPATIVLTRNYGEAGAVERYVPALAHRVYSGHNAMHDLAAPPAATRNIVAVGYNMSWLRPMFTRCRTVAHLHDPAGIASQEVGAPIQVCTGRVVPMSAIWAQARWVG